MNRAYSWIKVLSTWCVGLLCALAFGQVAATQISGALFTSTSDGQTVDGNIYSSKSDVYINGGPQNKNGSLLPPGTYYFQVTDPNGSVLLSLDPAVCRQVTVDQSGRITGVVVTGCEHNTSPPNNNNGNTPVQLCNPDPSLCDSDFADTPNSGGEYKAWLISQDASCATSVDPNDPTGAALIFTNDCAKTDNFKIKEANLAFIVACKFDDQNGDHQQEANEPLLDGWIITASIYNNSGTFADGSTADQSAATGTSGDGCVSFSVSPKTQLSLTETQMDGWVQTTPQDTLSYPGYTGSGNPAAAITNAVQEGDTITVFFGNHNPTGEAGLTISKTATPTVKYTWTPNKSVNPKGPIELQSGSQAFTYTVTASHDTGAWTVVGNITLTNGTNSPITVTVSDSAGGVTCKVIADGNGTQSGNNAIETVPANTQISPAYTCDFGTTNPGAGTNTVTAVNDQINIQNTWKYDSSLSATVIDNCDYVTDSFNPQNATPSLPATVCVGDPGDVNGTFTFTYTRSISVLPNCNSYKNTVTTTTNTTGTIGSASVTVEVCGPAKTGALTMGFWQNKNGQGIIAGAGPASGTCSLTTWLRQYLPFDDLSSTAGCGKTGSTSNSDVVGYVYNVIKAANASGSSMNAMLKAQMLATALDVYFGGGPGGNKIAAPVVIGNVNIDLTHICKMIDSSGGGSCSGSYENSSPAFGNNACQTVSQMLSDASSNATMATLANTLASPWYSQNKATQQLAKDAFDAVNNGVAFPCP